MCISYSRRGAAGKVYCLFTSFTPLNDRKSRLSLDSLGYIESTINGMLHQSIDLATIITVSDLTRSPFHRQLYHSYNEIAL